MVASEDPNGRVVKRQKLENGITPQRHTAGASRLFAPYRTVGLVSPTAVPFTSTPLGRTTYQITTSVGRSLQTYDLRRGLNLVFITRPQTPETITASIAWKDRVIAAWGGDGKKSRRGVWVFKRGKKEAELEQPASWTENVKSFCIFGSWIVGICRSRILIWKSTNLELYTTLNSALSFSGCVTSLPTFLNKIIVGKEDGSTEIWSVLSGKLLHTVYPPSTSCGAVTAVEPTPMLSLVAIAFANGQLLIHDIHVDATVMQFTSPKSTPVTSITFRTDGMGAGEDGQKPGVMATASTATGDVTLWDLNDGGRKSGVLQAAHANPTSSSPGGVSRIEFLSGQAILVSTGLDNSLKTWIFDETPFSAVPRILHERRGHAATVSRLMFLPSPSDGSDDIGKWLMSGSDDRSLWGWSLRRDGQSAELSQGAIQKKAKKQGLLTSNSNEVERLKCPPVIAIACSLNRDGGIGAMPGKQPIWQQGAKGAKASAEISAMTGWESVLTAHQNDKKARTWFWGRKRAGRWAFDTGDGSNVTAISMSPCGTFALVGSEKGGIDMFNMQSGLHRQRYPARLTPMQAKQLRLDVQKHGLIEEHEGKSRFYRGQGKHGAAVIGLAIDSLNKTVVSAGADGKIKMWDFSTGLLRHQVDWSNNARIHGMRFHRASDLAAFACSDGCVRVMDIATQKLVRELWPCRTPLPELKNTKFSDFTFSDDGRWVAACARQLVFTWDLPTGHLIDAFKLRSACSSLAFAPTGEFLATSMQDSVGVDIWSNRSLFANVATRNIDKTELAAILKSSQIHAPTASGEGGQNLLLANGNLTKLGDVEKDIIDGPNGADLDIDLLSEDLVSLSLIPRSRWQNLLHLDLIRQRNKPTEPPKKPEKAPFFLPSLQDRQRQDISLATANTDTEQLEIERTRVLKLSREGGRSEFSSLLLAAAQSKMFGSFLNHLKGLNPAAADIEIRSLSSEGEEFTAYVQALTTRLKEKQDFELVQTWMSVFLRIHGDVILNDENVRHNIDEWQQALDEERQRVQGLIGYCSGLVSFLRAGRV